MQTTLPLLHYAWDLPGEHHKSFKKKKKKRKARGGWRVLHLLHHLPIILATNELISVFSNLFNIALVNSVKQWKEKKKIQGRSPDKWCLSGCQPNEKWDLVVSNLGQWWRVINGQLIWTWVLDLIWDIASSHWFAFKRMSLSNKVIV